MRKAALMLHHATENVPIGRLDAHQRRAMAEALEILARELRQENTADPVIEGEVVE
ncbi:hypothetical protein GCM10027174_03560 [Salinifilum aidingensis]